MLTMVFITGTGVYAHHGVYNRDRMLTVVFITGTGVYAHRGVYNRDRGLCLPWCL